MSKEATHVPAQSVLTQIVKKPANISWQEGTPLRDGRSLSDGVKRLAPNTTILIQSKLKIGAPHDKYEQEADRVADQVLRIPQHAGSGTTGITNNIATPNSQRLCTGCQGGLEQNNTVQTKTASGHPVAVTPNVANGIQSLKGSGQPLPEASRNYFEPRFGHDFSQVRIHADNRAADLARGINARAFTLGRDVVFGAGQYQSDNHAGQRLMAHELTHVIQQKNTSSLIQAEFDWGRGGIGAGIGAGSGALVGAGLGAIFGGGIGALIGAGIGAIVGGLTGLLIGGLTGSNTNVSMTPAQLATLTPWQLTQLPRSAFTPVDTSQASNALVRYARARRLAQLIFRQLGVNYDIDRTSRPIGREPNASELAIINQGLNQILGVQGVRTQVTGPSGRGIPTGSGSSTPSLQGRARIARNVNEYIIKRYQLQMIVQGLSGHPASELDDKVERLWQQYGITGSRTSITDQERRLAILVRIAETSLFAPGFYHPVDDMIYLRPGANLQSAADVEVIRHETAHFLGGRERTRQAFVARYGNTRYLQYWLTFEEGMAELLTIESRPPGQQTPQTTTTTRTEGNTTTTVTTGGSGYDREVRIMRSIMSNRLVGRQALLQAYFTGVIPGTIFRLLEQQLGSP